MKNIFSNITWRTMKQNRSRTIVTIIGVILSTAMISAVTTFGVSVHDFLVKESIRQDGNWHMSMQPVSKKLKEKICSDERIELIGTTTSIGYAKSKALREEELTPYFHIESYSEECLDMLNLDLVEGRKPRNDSEIIVSAFLLTNQEADNQLAIGDKLTLEVGKRMLGEEEVSDERTWLSFENPDLAPEIVEELGGEEHLEIEAVKEYTIVGTYLHSPLSDFSSGIAYQLIAGPMEETADTYGMVIRLKSPWDVNAFEEEIQAEDLSGMEYCRNNNLLRWYGVDKNNNFLAVIVGLLGIVIVLIMAASISLIYNVFSISMRERTGQFGLLASVGATRKQLKKSLQSEAWIVCLTGIPLGLISGVAGIGITLYFVGPMLSDWIYGVNTGVPLKISVVSIVSAVVIAFVTVRISVWIPARRLKKLSPLEAIRASRDIKRTLERQKRNGIFEKVFGLEGMLASRNYQRDKRKYRMTVVSLTLSIVLFVTAGSYILYLGKAGKDALISSQVDLSIAYVNPEKRDLAMKELEQTEGIDKVRSYRKGLFALHVDQEMVPGNMWGMFLDVGDGTFVHGCLLNVLPDDQFAEYAREVGADPKKYINQEELKAIYKDNVRVYDIETEKYRSNSMLEKIDGMEFELGDSTALNYEAEDFGVMKNIFRVTAEDQADIYPKESTDSYYSAMVSFMIAESTFEKAGAGIDREYMDLYFSVNSKDYKNVYQKLIEKSQDETSSLYESVIVNMNESFDKHENIMTVIRVLTTGFVVLMSLIAVANIFNTISTNLYLRRGEFAMLRSAGMTEKGFWKMMGCECLIYGLRSMIYGVLISGGSSYLVYLSLQSGVEFSYILPWQYWLTAVVGVLLVVGITMLYAMRKIKKDNIIEVLKQRE